MDSTYSGKDIQEIKNTFGTSFARITSNDIVEQLWVWIKIAYRVLWPWLVYDELAISSWQEIPMSLPASEILFKEE